MRSRRISRCESWKNAFARLKNPRDTGNLRSDSSLCPPGALCQKFFRGSSKTFNTEYRGKPRRIARWDRTLTRRKAGKRSADFCSSNVWSRRLGRTKRPVRFSGAGFAGGSKAEGAPNRRSRRDVRVLVSAQARIRNDRPKLHLSRNEGRNRFGGVRWRDGRFCRSENKDWRGK